MKNSQLVQVSTSDGLYLHGYYVRSNKKKVAILHIHGFEGNFYENNFVHVLANQLEQSNIAFLTVNTRGNGQITNFNTVAGNLKTIGAHLELLEQAHLDITAWVKFLLDEGYKEIILQGHSLGTMKAVRYLFEGELKEKIGRLILLAPFDKKGLMLASGRVDIEGLLNKAQVWVDEGRGEEFITPEFDSINLSYQTFISLYKQDDLGRMFEFCSSDYSFPILNEINIPAKIIVGTEDEFFHQSNSEHPEQALDILLKNIRNAKGILIKNAPHSFTTYEKEMANEVVKFVVEGE